MFDFVSDYADHLIRITHILSGVLAVTSGALALGARKGHGLHKHAGRWFVVSMLVSSLLGCVAGVMAFQAFYITIHAGILSMTLILTSWQIVISKGARTQAQFGVIVALSGLNTLGLLAAMGYAFRQPDTVLFGFPAVDYAFLAGIAAVALIGEIRILLKGELSIRQRLAAHLWRMCVAFFIAAGSAFTGPGAEVFPAAVRTSNLLSLPEVAIFCAMIYWLIRVWRGKPLS